MKKVWVNYWVDVVTGGAFLLCAVTGLVFLFLPGLVRVSGGAPTILGVSSAAWHWVHDWSGVVMTAGVGLHLVLHFKWIAKMTAKLGARRQPAAVRDQTGALAPAPSVAAAAAPPTGWTGPRDPDATFTRPRRLAESGASAPRRVSRKEFLVGAAAVGGSALLVGLMLTGSDGSSAATPTDTGWHGGQGGWSSQTGGSGESSDSSSGSSAGDQSGTETSARVVVSASSCIGCSRCLQVCPADVFTISGGKADAGDPQACRLCGRCVEVCPTSAIVLNG